MLKPTLNAALILLVLALVALAISPEYGGWANQPHTRFTRLAPDQWQSNQGAVTANIRGANLGPEAGPAYLFAVQESDDDLQYVGRIAVTKSRKMLFFVQSDVDPLSYNNVAAELSHEGFELYGEDGSVGTLKIVAGHLVFRNEAGQETIIAQ